MNKRIYRIVSFLVIVSLLLTGCGGAGSSDQKKLTGKWVSSGVDTELQDKSSEADTAMGVLVGLNLALIFRENVNIEFLSDGTMQAGTSAFPYTIVDNKLKVQVQEASFVFDMEKTEDKLFLKTDVFTVTLVKQ